jgi:hypothetical protein
MPVMRSTFRPDGSILTISRNSAGLKKTINITKIPITKGIDHLSLQETRDKQEKVLLAFSKIDDVNGRMSLMKITSADPSQVSLPNVEFDNSPIKIYEYLKGLSEITADKIKSLPIDSLTRQLLNEELYAYCIMNALFGYPNDTLIHLHPEFKGIRRDLKTKPYID